LFKKIERRPGDSPRSKGGEMLETTAHEVEFTAEGTLLEVLRVVDVKNPVAPVRSASASG
jgi:hypothetical protein